MIKRVLSLIIFLLLLNAGARVGMVYFHHQQFKDALSELSLFSGTKAEEIVRAKVMELAAENQIPLDPDYVEIMRKNVPGIGDHSSIKVSYAVNVRLFPGAAPRRFQFDYTTP
jgi:hypothetical protein